MIVVDVALANADPVSASMKVKAFCSSSSSAVSLLIFFLCDQQFQRIGFFFRHIDLNTVLIGRNFVLQYHL